MLSFHAEAFDPSFEVQAYLSEERAEINEWKPIVAHCEDVGVRAWLARGYFIPGGTSQRGGFKLQRSVSHIVGHGHLLPSG